MRPIAQCKPFCFWPPSHAFLWLRLGVGRDYNYARVRRSPEHFTFTFTDCRPCLTLSPALKRSNPPPPMGGVM